MKEIFAANLWLVFALLAAFSASLVSIFGKIGLQTVDANTATAVRAVIMALFLLGVVFFQGSFKEIPAIINDHKTFGFIILSGVSGALSWLFYFLALKVGKVTQVAPVDKFSVVLAAILAVIFLSEKINLLNLIGLSLITVGVILVAVS
ncbi:MAG: EamA family transporter [Sporomusaceae bacterium]|nr:EamA family transporter [Sporomusaceae bacterium]